MLIVLTNSRDATADHLQEHLEAASISHVRIDTDDFIDRAALEYRLSKPSLILDGRRFEADAVSNVWYRRPERLKSENFGSDAEGQLAISEWTEALEGFLAHIPRACWCNHPARNVNAAHKPQQLTTAVSFGLTVPKTLLTQSPVDALQFFEDCDGRVVVKPLAGGYLERENGSDGHIYTNLVTASDVEAMHDVAHCPTYLQQYIEKDLDVRITVVDDGIHTVSLRATDDTGEQRCDIRRNNMEDVQYGTVALPMNVLDGIRTMMSHYGLRFAAIDMCVDRSGNWVFLEINPNGQWAWLDTEANQEIAESFVRSFSNGDRIPSGL
jgi:predicted ATP-grasp superfamily ATP-dependent carboligase